MVVLTIFAVSAIAAALGIGVLWGYYASEAERRELRSDIETLSTELKNATASLSAAREESAAAIKRAAVLTGNYLAQTDRVRVAEQQRNDAQERSNQLESEVALLKERGSQLAAKVAAQSTELLEMQKKLAVELEDAPIRILKGGKG